MLALFLYRTAKTPKRILSQLPIDGYDEGRAVVVVDSKNRSALDAAAACFTILSTKPVTKSTTGPITVAALARSLASSEEDVAIVLGEEGLVALAEGLLPEPPLTFDVGHAVLLEIEAPNWKDALGREHAWEFRFTLVPEEGR